MTFAEYIASWRATHLRRHKQSTQTRTESCLRTQLLPVFGARQLATVTGADVQRWYDQYSSTAPAGANRALEVLRAVFSTAEDRGMVERNPTAGLRNRQPPRTRFLSRAEVDALYRRLDEAVPHSRGSGPQQADIIRLLLLTGCRKSEIIELRWSEVTDDNCLRLRDSTNGPRIVICSAPARAIINRQPRTGSPWVFPDPACPDQHRSGNLSLWRKVQPTGVRLHDLRHTFASHAVMLGTPLPVLAQMLGHSSVAMTQRYAHLADSHVREAAERVGVAMDATMTER